MVASGHPRNGSRCKKVGAGAFGRGPENWHFSYVTAPSGRAPGEWAQTYYCSGSGSERRWN